MSNVKKAEFWAKKLGKCPGIRAVFLSGSLAQGHGNEASDIDFFIITTPGRIWTARFFVFITLKIHRELAKPHHHAGKICPNHFITSDALEIVEKDPYSAHLFSHNRPLFDPRGYFSHFAAANTWVEVFSEQFSAPAATTTIAPEKSTYSLVESILKTLQTVIIKRNPEYQTPGSRIVLSNTELRFHPVPRNKNWKKPLS